MSKHDAYYEPEDIYDDDGARFNAVVSELLLSEKDLDSSSQSNFSDAISNLTDADWAGVKDFIDQKDWAKLGLKLQTIVYKYVEDMAIERVTNHPEWLYD